MSKRVTGKANGYKEKRVVIKTTGGIIGYTGEHE